VVRVEVSQADSRIGPFRLRVEPSGREGFWASSGCALCGGLYALDSTDLVDDAASLFGEVGPFGRGGPVVAGLEDPVGDGDLASGPVGLRAPAVPGWAAAVVSVEERFDV
jgi:hypothetical protein